MLRYPTPALAIGSMLLGTLLGCQSPGAYVLNTLSTIGLAKKPLTIGLVLEQKPAAALTAINPFSIYAGLQAALAKEMDRPIAVDPCVEFQAQLGLPTGLYDLAVMTPAQYVRLPEPRPSVLVVTVDEQDRAARPAVLLVAHDAALTDVAELRGKRVAFGAADDTRTHHAALQLLAEAGLKAGDLKLDLPGTLRHTPDVAAALRDLTAGHVAAAFIDVQGWETLPAEGSDKQPGQAQFRVLAETMPVPARVIAASPTVDALTLALLRQKLTHLSEDYPEAFKPLGIRGYRVPEAGLLAPFMKVNCGVAPLPLLPPVGEK